MTEVGFSLLDVGLASTLPDGEDKKTNKRFKKKKSKSFLHILHIYTGFNASVGTN